MANPNIPHICQHCGTTFYPLRASKGMYCSNPCRFEAAKINRHYQCKGCGESFVTKRKDRSTYCSNPCYQASKRRKTAKERLYTRIHKTDGCWLWQGNRNTLGYGRVYYQGRMHQAHRLIYAIETGENLDGKVVRHYVCDNPPCCNPAHLRSGTHKDNMMDAIRHHRHAHGETSYAKLTEQQVRQILKDTRTQNEIAKSYGVGRKTIDHIKNRRTWKHIQIE
ncbi:MAG: HNH endonuclease [Acidobacteria bacterium]|nr:HNH endonuclease [Acidobacteriota bacterium]